MQAHYLSVLRRAERETDIQLRHLVTEGKAAGAVFDIRAGIAHKLSGAQLAPLLVYLTPESRYYGDANLLRALRSMLDFTLRNLRPDGTVDLYLANFHSAPDSAFAILRYEDALDAMESAGDVPGKEALRDAMLSLENRLADGVMDGGFHTPNHRWVISAALARAARRLNRPELLTRAHAFLAEGMDCNEDGQYAERSAGGYDYINNNALMLIAGHMNRPDLLEPVRRNLVLLRSLFEPDGSIFTEYSTRQDHGARVYAERYFGQFLAMWRLTGEAALLSEAARLYEAWTAGLREAPDDLLYYGRYPELKTLPLPPAGEPWRGAAFLTQSGMARLVTDAFSATCIRGSADFLWVKTRDVSMFLRIGVHFFDCRHFVPETLVRDGDTWRMRWEGRGNYRLPLEPPVETSDWWKMDHTRRKTVRELTLSIDVAVTPCEDGLELDVQTGGCDDVPVRLEWNFAGGVQLETQSAVLLWNPGARLVVREGDIVAGGVDGEIRLGPCFGENRLVDGLWGALPVSKAHMNAYCTAPSPINRRLSLRVR